MKDVSNCVLHLKDLFQVLFVRIVISVTSEPLPQRDAASCECKQSSKDDVYQARTSAGTIKTQGRAIKPHLLVDGKQIYLIPGVNPPRVHAKKVTWLPGRQPFPTLPSP